MEQWQDTEAALAQLYRYAEGRAIDAIDWYLLRLERERSNGAATRPGSVPLPSAAEP
jgi:hypothetical protein